MKAERDAQITEADKVQIARDLAEIRAAAVIPPDAPKNDANAAPAAKPGRKPKAAPPSDIAERLASIEAKLDELLKR